MSRYVGKKCVICDNCFTDDDDIVVCPECGTPYHRNCYDAAGKCVAEGLHQSGTSWHTFQIETGNIVVCKKCGFENASSAIFCEKCGTPTRMTDNNTQQYVNVNNGSDERTQVQNPFFIFFDEYCGLSPEEEFEGVKVKEIAEFIGPNKRYFLPIFKSMKETNRKFSINLPAALFPHYYFGYRKMYLPMLSAVLCNILLEIELQFEYLEDSSTLIYSLLAKYPELFEHLNLFSQSQLWSVLSKFILIFGIVITFSFAFFSNWIYYRHCIKKIKKIKKKNNRSENLKTILIKRGGTTFFGILLAFILLLPFIALGMAENMHMIK